jgi:hypothetical protein
MIFSLHGLYEGKFMFSFAYAKDSLTRTTAKKDAAAEPVAGDS